MFSFKMYDIFCDVHDKRKQVVGCVSYLETFSAYKVAMNGRCASGALFARTCSAPFLFSVSAGLARPAKILRSDEKKNSKNIYHYA